MERCEDCGFAWESVPASDVGERTRRGALRIAELLQADGVARRPEPNRWSGLEYAAHVRDVLLNLRDRIVVALVEDDPGFKPMYRDQRVDLGLYASDTPAIVRQDLDVASDLFCRTFAALSTEQLARPCQYAYPTLTTRSVFWMARQVVHEVEHHLGDIEENAAEFA
jgi:DinB family protein